METPILMIIGTIFLMELGDKTQLATVAFASQHNALWVYVGVVLGLALCTVLSVLIGGAIERYVPKEYLRYVVGSIFLITGVWTLLSH